MVFFRKNSVICYFNPRSPRGLRPAACPDDSFTPDISIHAAQEGCDDYRGCWFLPYYAISIHAAQKGCDIFFFKGINLFKNFNPRSPRGLRLPWGPCMPCGPYFNPRSPRGLRRLTIRVNTLNHIISIHAAQEGCDRFNKKEYYACRNFNPRSPRGLRRKPNADALAACYFNPRSPRGLRLP